MAAYNRKINNYKLNKIFSGDIFLIIKWVPHSIARCFCFFENLLKFYFKCFYSLSVTLVVRNWKFVLRNTYDSFKVKLISCFDFTTSGKIFAICLCCDIERLRLRKIKAALYFSKLNFISLNLCFLLHQSYYLWLIWNFSCSFSWISIHAWHTKPNMVN